MEVMFEIVAILNLTLRLRSDSSPQSRAPETENKVIPHSVVKRIGFLVITIWNKMKEEGGGIHQIVLNQIVKEYWRQ